MLPKPLHIDPCPKFTCQLRALGSELRAHIKGNDPSFDISKLAFFAEATGTVQEGHILAAQSAVANARRSSLQAGFNLFKTSLDNDQVLHERHLQASKTDETKARSAALASLEVGWVYTKFSLLFVYLILVCWRVQKVCDLGRECILQRGTWSRALRVKICLRGTQRQRRCKARPSNNPNQFKLFCDGIFENELIPYLCQSVEISVQKLEKSKSKPTQLVARLLPIQFHLQWVWCFVTWTLHNPLS